MKRRRLYIGISILITLLIAALVGWALFVGNQQQELQKDTADLGYFGGSTDSSGGGGLFGGIFGGDNDPENTTVSTEPQPILRQLYNLPTAGFIKKRSNAIRFVDRATGHVFERDLPEGATTRVDQTTVPQVYEAYLTEDGDGVIRRYIDSEDNITSVYSRVGEGDKNRTLSNANTIRVMPSGSSILYIEETGAGSVLSTLSLEEGSAPKKVTSSNLRGWEVDAKDAFALLTQKPSGTLPGSSYVLDLTTGAKKLILQQATGLMAKISPDGTRVLYSDTQEGSLPKLSIRNIETNATIRLDASGFAEKCVWSLAGAKIYCALPNSFPQVLYPDAWYQGDVHFSDSLWEIDTLTGEMRQLFSPKESEGISIDMVSLSTDLTGRVIFFINKTDQTLWSITLPSEEEVSDTAENES